MPTKMINAIEIFFNNVDEPQNAYLKKYKHVQRIQVQEGHE